VASPKPTKRAGELPTMPFATRAAWEAWLEAEHAASAGVWIAFARKASGIASVSHDEALDAALCYGWIDGQTARLDGTRWRQRFTRRGPRSKWSQINCAKATALIAEGENAAGRRRRSGAARRDGRWGRPARHRAT
jgi:uncharacterized protein YdeI (YjbR/CyaY-like superfamily)